MVIYVAAPGDTIESIAQAYRVNARRVAEENAIPADAPLTPGQTVVLTAAMREPTWGLISAYGFAYAPINEKTFQNALPALSAVAVFSARFDEQGNLVGADDARILKAIKQSGAAAALTLTNTDENGDFSPSLAENLLYMPDSWANLGDALIKYMKERGYDELCIDIEFVPKEAQRAFTNFVSSITKTLHGAGLSVSVCLPANFGTETNLPDYAAIGAVVDSVILMAYEYGTSNGEPAPVAPLDWVSFAVDYTVKLIPPAKLLLGIPNYGYDWPDNKPARSISNPDAPILAREHNTAIEYDPIAHSPYFMYKSNSTEHTVWFEDARSIYSKLQLVHAYGLRGVSYWALNRPFPQLYLVQQALYDRE